MYRCTFSAMKLRQVIYVLKDRQTDGQIIVCTWHRRFAKIHHICPFINDHGEMTWRCVVEGNCLKLRSHSDEERNYEYRLCRLENLPTFHYISAVHSLNVGHITKHCCEEWIDWPVSWIGTSNAQVSDIKERKKRAVWSQRPGAIVAKTRFCLIHTASQIISASLM